MWKALPLPPRVQALLVPGAGLSRQQLLAAGASDTHIARLLRHGRLRRLGNGRYFVVAEDGVNWRSSHVRELRTVQQKFPDVIISHRSAAVVQGLTLWRYPPTPELIRHTSRNRLAGMTMLRTCLAENEVEVVDGLQVTTVERTAVDLALANHTPIALVALDSALRRGTSPTSIMASLASRGPAPGVGRAREAIALGDGHSESALESFSRGVLIGRGLPRPLVNPWLRLDSGWVRTDLLWSELEVVGEADGAVKYASASTSLWAEKLRQEAIEEAGFLVLRWTYDEIIRYPERVADRFWRLVGRRRQRPARPVSTVRISRDRPINW